jgi:amiloride-sensitive sodium channel
VTPKSHRTDEALRRFDPEQRKCYFEGERQLKYFKAYTKAHCEWECRSNATLKHCGCVKFSMPRDKYMPVCNLSMLACILDVKSSFCDCYQPCIDLKYGYRVDKTNFNRRLFDLQIPAK